MLKRALQQGEADGLCGLYSIVNFLRIVAQWTDGPPEETMRTVMASVAAENLFDPNHVIGGYTSGELALIANHLFNLHLVEFQAHEVCTIRRYHSRETAYELYNRILLAGGSIIGGPKGRGHWVLITCVNDRNIILDSDNPTKSIKAFDRRQPRYCANEAVAFVPCERAQVDL